MRSGNNGYVQDQEVAKRMVSDQKNTPIDHNGKDEQSANFKAFVKGTEAAEHRERKQEKATGTHKFIDQQNKLIDQHNLRK
jgi:hypothetical protein